MAKLSNIFNIEYWQRWLWIKSDIEKWKIPFISSWWLNNWIFWYFDLIPKYKNVISVPRVWTIWYAFYQWFDCCIDDNCLVMIPKKELSMKEFFYYVLLVRQNKYRFMYWRQITPKKLWDIIIPEKIPTFVYNSKVPDYSDIKEKLNIEKLNLYDRKFEYFEYQELFNLEKWKWPSANFAENNTWKTPFISATRENNWISCFVDYKVSHKWNVITIPSNWNSVWEAYFQDSDFCSTWDVNILTPKFGLNKYIWIFISTMVRKDKYRYNYGRKWWLDKMKTSKIKLPVDNAWNPDFDFMENYIKSLPYSKYL